MKDSRRTPKTPTNNKIIVTSNKRDLYLNGEHWDCLIMLPIWMCPMYQILTNYQQKQKNIKV